MSKKQQPTKPPKSGKSADTIAKGASATLSEEELKRVSGGLASIKVDR